jgi:hypothetical protein
MYIDLAERIADHKINLENFLLFFHKNGYWGERLFKEFDYDESSLISEEEFIRGIGTASITKPRSLSQPKRRRSVSFSNSFLKWAETRAKA